MFLEDKFYAEWKKEGGAEPSARRHPIKHYAFKKLNKRFQVIRYNHPTPALKAAVARENPSNMVLTRNVDKIPAKVRPKPDPVVGDSMLFL